MLVYGMFIVCAAFTDLVALHGVSGMAYYSFLFLELNVNDWIRLRIQLVNATS